NPNRNPSSRDEKCIEQELERFGVRRTIWLDGDRFEPITSGHVDGYVLFNAAGSVLAEACADECCEPLKRCRCDVGKLEQTKDAAGRILGVRRIKPPRKRYWKFCNDTFAPCYLNVYVANDAVIAPDFGDTERDEATIDALTMAFPGRTVVALKIDHIAGGG